MQTQQCLNCSAELREEFAYCPACGQSTHVHRLNLAHLGHELVHFFTHADKGIFFLVRMLATRTGRVAREYIEGRRKRYFSPLNFFLIVIGLFVFVQTSFKPLEGSNLAGVKESVRKIPDRVQRERRLEKLERIEKGSAFMARYSNVINFVLTPFVALIFYLAYWRNRYNYTEHLVASLYISGMNALFFILVITPYLILARDTPYFYFGIYTFFAFEIIYRTIFYYHFINRRGIGYILLPLFLTVLQVFGWMKLSTYFFKRFVDTGSVF